MFSFLNSIVHGRTLRIHNSMAPLPHAGSPAWSHVTMELYPIPQPGFCYISAKVLVWVTPPIQARVTHICVGKYCHQDHEDMGLPLAAVLSQYATAL